MRNVSPAESSADDPHAATMGQYETSWNTPYETIQIYANGFMAADNSTEYYVYGGGQTVTAENYGHVDSSSAAELAFFNAVNDLQSHYAQQLDAAQRAAFEHGVDKIELYNYEMAPMQKIAGVAYVPVHEYSENNYAVLDGDLLSALSNS